MYRNNASTHSTVDEEGKKKGQLEIGPWQNKTIQCQDPCDFQFKPGVIMQIPKPNGLLRDIAYSSIKDERL